VTDGPALLIIGDAVGTRTARNDGFADQAHHALA
jgi:hypothetical protein